MPESKLVLTFTTLKKIICFLMTCTSYTLLSEQIPFSELVIITPKQLIKHCFRLEACLLEQLLLCLLTFLALYRSSDDKL